MKIVYLAAALSIHTVRWVNEMAKRGYKIHLITMHPPNTLNRIDNNISMHILPFSPPAGYFLNKWHLKKLLRKINPDLLHTHYASGYGTLSRLSGFHPTLLSVWGSDVFVFPYQAKWKEKILRDNLANADYITAVCCAMKQRIEAFANPKHEITVVPFGVNCEIFKPFDKSKNLDEFIVGSTRTLEKGYGIEYLIRAFKLVKNNYHGQKRIVLSIIGDGPLKQRFMNLVTELGIGNETKFLGYVPDLPNVLNKFSVFVSVPDSDGLSTSVIESLSCGVPVVISNVGGGPELVKNNETGFIVPMKNPQATSDAIMKLIENAELRKKMGIAGRNFVLQNYEWNENASRMEKLYENIIEEFKSGNS